MYIPALDPVKHYVICDLNGNGIIDSKDACIYDGATPSKTVYTELLPIRTFLKLGSNLQLANGVSGGNIIVHDIAGNSRSWNENRDYLYPIPQDQITLYGGRIQQNPNW